MVSPAPAAPCVSGPLTSSIRCRGFTVRGQLDFRSWWARLRPRNPLCERVSGGLCACAPCAYGRSRNRIRDEKPGWRGEAAGRGPRRATNRLPTEIAQLGGPVGRHWSRRVPTGFQPPRRVIWLCRANSDRDLRSVCPPTSELGANLPSRLVARWSGLPIDREHPSDGSHRYEGGVEHSSRFDQHAFRPDDKTESPDTAWLLPGNSILPGEAIRSGGQTTGLATKERHR